MSTAAIQASYSDLKFVRTRKVCQIVLEVPIEQSSQVMGVLGAPNPAEEVWVAIARLAGSDNAGSTPAPASRRQFSDLPPAQQAALACQREAFQRFLHECEGVDLSEDAAAAYVRLRCNVDSRSDLNSKPHAAAIWSDLYNNFQLWLEAA